jgi:hypothetical protein
MKRKLLSITITALLAAMAGYSANVVAAKGTPGPPNGGGEDPTAVNHLSYPALKMNGESLATYFFNVGAASAGSLGTTYSYGCDKVEVVDVSGTKFTYPNTSCVSGWKEDGSAVAFLTPDECTLDDNNPLTPHPCLGHTVDRIYWQKIDGNTWSADAAVPNNAAGSAPVVVRYLDWGDSIESVTWKDTSVLRVETQVYADLSQDSRASDVPSGTQRGLQMWHSQGHGINEQWGVRASVGTENVTPWVYAAPVAIVNAGTASLYLSKLFPQTDTQMGGCPVAGGDIPPDYPDDYPWTTTFGWTGSGWTSTSKDPCDLPVVPYTVELSVTGKFVHGYNWRMRDMDAALAKACPTFAKSLVAADLRTQRRGRQKGHLHDAGW